ncbi:MAG: MGMT family protein [Planctomycetia bacterium]|nr:MGMT family protein [Planctomycetia bacterium]
MGQRPRPADDRRRPQADVPDLSIFPTNLGWFGLLGRADLLLGVLVGHASAPEVRRAAARQLGEADRNGNFRECDWSPELRRRLAQYALGARVEFHDVQLELPGLTDFQRRVFAATRRIRYGQTLSYGELAEKAGFPRAARGVGTVMKSNRFPIVIPCHRVIAAGGRVGGYSSPQGVGLKLRLLAQEAGEGIGSSE